MLAASTLLSTLLGRLQSLTSGVFDAASELRIPPSNLSRSHLPDHFHYLPPQDIWRIDFAGDRAYSPERKTPVGFKPAIEIGEYAGVAQPYKPGKRLDSPGRVFDLEEAQEFPRGPLVV